MAKSEERISMDLKCDSNLTWKEMEEVSKEDRSVFVIKIYLKLNMALKGL